MKNIKIFIALCLTFLLLQKTNAQDTIRINLTEPSGVPGEQVCVDVSFTNFVDIQSVQFTLKYDPAKLTFVSIQKGALANLDPTIHFNSNKAGELRLAYADFIQGQNIPDGVTAFSFCFNIKGNVGDFDCLIFDNTGSITTEFSDSNGDIIPHKNKACNKISFVAPTLKPLRLAIDKGRGEPGDTVCVPIRVFDFQKIRTLGYTLNWDSQKLKFEYLSAVNTQFAPQGVNTNFYSINPQTGAMQINWNVALANTTSLTLPDSTVLFTLCFKVVGNAGDLTCLKVAINPVPNVITTTSNNQNVGLISSDGCVRIPAEINPVGLSFCNNNQLKKLNVGEEICMDVKVTNFDSIGGMALNINWDKNFFEFVRAEVVNPPDLVNGVTWTFNDLKVDEGFIGIGFESINYSTLPANTTAFRICLKARGVTGLTQGLKLAQFPIVNEVWSKASPNGEDIGFEILSDNCPILIESPIKIIDTLIVQPNCKNPIAGRINLTVGGGIEPYFYKWSPNAQGAATTKDVKDLPTGIFYCTVTDSNVPNPNLLIAIFDLAGDLTKPTATAKIIGNLECKDNSFVVLDGTGSSSGQFYTYKWLSENGVFGSDDAQITASALSATTYIFQVTDERNGCTKHDTVQVAPAPGAPIANAGPIKTVPCQLQNVPISLDGCQSSTTDVKYLWGSTNGGQVINNIDKCNPTVRGKATYILTVTSTTNNCKAYSKTQVIGDSNTPIAEAFVGDSLNCLNGVVTLDATQSSAGVGTKYEWISLNGNSILNSTNLKATANRAGDYILKVTNGVGCVASDTITVYDFRNDTVKANVITPARMTCDGSPTILNASASSKGANIVYSWVVAPNNPGIILSGANTPTPIIGLAGKYLFSVKNRISYCEDIAAVNVLNANVPQGVEAGVDSILTCNTREIQLSGEAPSGTDYDLRWTTRNGTIKSGATTLAPIISKAGTYLFTVTEKATNCKTLDSLVITADFEKPNAKIIGLKELTCGADSIQLNAEGSLGADLFEWFTQDGEFLTATTLSRVDVSKAGTYILLAKKVSNGCVDSAIHVINFILPDKGKTGKDTVLCTTNKFTLKATISGNSIGQWTSLDGAIVDDPTANITDIDSLKIGRNRFAWVLSAKGCPDFSKDTIEIFVETDITAKDDIVSQRNRGQSINLPLTNNDDLKGTKAWKVEVLGELSNGTLERVGQNLRFKPLACYAGVQEFNYQVCSQFCPTKCDTAKVKLNIQEDPTSCDSIVIQNVITPNGDGKNDIFRIDAIEFQPQRFKDAELIIFNRWGDVVYRSAKPYANDWTGTSSNGADLPEGTYYYLLDLNVAGGDSYRGDITILR
jgi:gliding motility-associated-like protein